MQIAGQDTPPFWQNDGLPIAVAHRGGDALGADKENSLAAFEAAYQLGYRWFETDVLPTKDGQLLATHGRGYQLHPNRDLPRRRTLRRMTYAEVQQKVRVGGEPPALLADLLAAFPDAKWFIDPKATAAVDPLVEVLVKSKVDLDRIAIGSYQQYRTRQVIDKLKARTGRGVCSVLGPIGAYALLEESDTPIRKLELRDRLLFRLFKLTGRLAIADQIVEKSGAASVHVPYRWVNCGTDFAEVAHRYGLRVVTWTPNTPADIAACLDHGVDAVMSDNIKELRRVLLARNSGNPSLKQPTN